jgi:hypothetical protein
MVVGIVSAVQLGAHFSMSPNAVAPAQDSLISSRSTLSLSADQRVALQISASQ